MSQCAHSATMASRSEQRCARRHRRCVWLSACVGSTRWRGGTDGCGDFECGRACLRRALAARVRLLVVRRCLQDEHGLVLYPFFRPTGETTSASTYISCAWSSLDTCACRFVRSLTWGATRTLPRMRTVSHSGACVRAHAQIVARARAHTPSYMVVQGLLPVPAAHLSLRAREGRVQELWNIRSKVRTRKL